MLSLSEALGSRYRLERELGQAAWRRSTWPRTSNTAAESPSRCSDLSSPQ